jgi:hypothetical protein
MMRRHVLLIAASFFTLAACSSGTKLAGSWHEPQMTGIPFQKVIVLVLAKDNIMRHIAEDDFVARVSGPTEAVAAYSLIPESELGDQEKIKARLTAANIDGAAVMRLIGSDEQVTYNPGSYVTAYYTFWGYYNYAYPMVFDTGYVTADRVVRIETNVYSVTGNKLIWAGSSESMNPDSAQQIVKNVVRLVVSNLKQNGIIR